MEKTFIINEKTIVARDFDFNMLADLDEMGIDAQMVFKSPMSACRAYLALCLNITKEEAGNELQAHMLKGGSVEELLTAFAEKLSESDFFQQTVANQTATTKKTNKK